MYGSGIYNRALWSRGEERKCIVQSLRLKFIEYVTVIENQLIIGNGDLALDSTLQFGRSNVENCYGIGMDKDSSEARCLLAGSPSFHIDAVEVWEIL